MDNFGLLLVQVLLCLLQIKCDLCCQLALLCLETLQFLLGLDQLSCETGIFGFKLAHLTLEVVHLTLRNAHLLAAFLNLLS